MERRKGKEDLEGVTFGPSHTGGLGSRWLLGLSPLPRARTLTGDADGRGGGEGRLAFHASSDGLVEQVDGPGTRGQAHYTFADVQLPQALLDALAHVLSTALHPGGS